MKQYGPRVRKYMSSRRGKRVMAALRRRTGAPTTSSTRTLATAVGNYRYSNPIPISMGNNRTHSFWRSTTISIPITELSGWASTSPSLAFGFALGQVWTYIGGAYNGTYSATVPNNAEFSALFDFYKINFVRMKLFFTNNNSSVNSPSTAMPLLHIVNDFDDVKETLSINSVMEKAGVRHVQFDATNSTGVNHWVKPLPQTYMSGYVVDDTVVGTNAGVPSTSQWINTTATNIVHCGTKLVYNNQGRNAGTDIGSMTVVFDIEFVFKATR